MGNPITWFEVNGAEPEQTAKFYSEVFGWHTEAVPGNYILIDTHAGKGINGGFGETREGQPPHTAFYVEDPDIQKVLDKAEKLGGKTMVPVTEVPDMVTFAQFTDPFGNLVGLVKGEGDVKVSEGSNPAVDWIEIVCTEPKKAWDFYKKLFGWKIEGGPGPEGQGLHGSIDTGGQGARGGIRELARRPASRDALRGRGRPEEVPGPGREPRRQDDHAAHAGRPEDPHRALPRPAGDDVRPVQLPAVDQAATNGRGGRAGARPLLVASTALPRTRRRCRSRTGCSDTSRCCCTPRSSRGGPWC